MTSHHTWRPMNALQHEFGGGLGTTGFRTLPFRTLTIFTVTARSPPPPFPLQESPQHAKRRHGGEFGAKRPRECSKFKQGGEHKAEICARSLAAHLYLPLWPHWQGPPVAFFPLNIDRGTLPSLIRVNCGPEITITPQVLVKLPITFNSLAPRLTYIIITNPPFVRSKTPRPARVAPNSLLLLFPHLPAWRPPIRRSLSVNPNLLGGSLIAINEGVRCCYWVMAWPPLGLLPNPIAYDFRLPFPNSRFMGFSLSLSIWMND